MLADVAPGESTPEKTAPRPLDLVQRFVNSIDLETGEDELEDPGALRTWLAERDLIAGGARVGAADLRRAVDVREGLRALMLGNNGLDVDESKVERLDAAAGQAAVRVRFRAGSDPRLEGGADGVAGAIGQLLGIAASAAQNGTWERLKACPREDCEWAFYDRSKNRSGRWCRMEDCGNIAKARSFRERRRSGGPART